MGVRDALKLKIPYFNIIEQGVTKTKALQQGIKTPQKEMDLVESRLKRAQEIYKELYKKK